MKAQTNPQYILLITILIVCLALGSCNPPGNSTSQPAQPAELATATLSPAAQPSSTLPNTDTVRPEGSSTPVPTETSSVIGMPNPAAVFCEEQGGRVEIQTAADGSQSGACVFQDGSQCDEWAFYRGECKPTSTKTITFVTPPPNLIPAPIPLPYAAIVRQKDLVTLALHARDGSLLKTWKLGDLAPTNALIAGSATDLETNPLIYISTENELSVIKTTLGHITSPLVTYAVRASLSGLANAPGSPFIAYAINQPDPNGAYLESHLYAADYQKIAQSDPILSMDSCDSRILMPLALRVENEALAGVWFTQQLTGIGGDLFTNESGGLYFLDLASGVNYEFLSLEHRLSSLSINQTLAAWTQPGSAMQVTNFQSSQTIRFPLRSDSERGAVRAFFSPSNTYLAWLEGKGIEWDGNLATVLRIGTLDGQVIAEYPDIEFIKVAGLGESLHVVPMGWLDENTVLVQAYVPGKQGDGVIIRLDVTNNELAQFASGYFVNFAYP